MEFPNRRLLVRVYYPVNCSPEYLPVLTIHKNNYRVLDISEKGIRFHNPYNHLFTNDLLHASLQFPDGEVVAVTGNVIRRSPMQIALKLVNGIPYKRIMSEQVRLQKLRLDGILDN